MLLLFFSNQNKSARPLKLATASKWTVKCQLNIMNIIRMCACLRLSARARKNITMEMLLYRSASHNHMYTICSWHTHTVSLHLVAGTNIVGAVVFCINSFRWDDENQMKLKNAHTETQGTKENESEREREGEKRASEIVTRRALVHTKCWCARGYYQPHQTEPNQTKPYNTTWLLIEMENIWF